MTPLALKARMESTSRSQTRYLAVITVITIITTR